MGNEGINKLASTVNGRIQDNQEAHSDLVLDFGNILDDWSLRTNTYPIPIPRSDYYVCRSLTLGTTGSSLTTTSTDGSHSHGSAGEHSHPSAGSHEHSGAGSHDHSGGDHSHSGGKHEKHESGTGEHSHSGGDHSHSGGTHSHGSAGDHSHGAAGSHSHGSAGSHNHSVTVPEKMRSLKPGDRVLVAWVQSDAVVIDIIS